MQQASGGQRKPVSAARGEGQWGRLDRLVDMSMTHRVWASLVDGQSGGWGSIQARTPRREACPQTASRPAPVSEAMQGEGGGGEVVTGLRRGLAFGEHLSLFHNTLPVVHLALAKLPFSVSQAKPILFFFFF